MDHKSLKRFCLTTSFFCSTLIIDRKEKTLHFLPISNGSNSSQITLHDHFLQFQFFKNQTKSIPTGRAVAGEKWSSSSAMRQVRTSARTGVHQKQMMRVERFKAQRNDGVRKTLTLHLLLFLCKQQQHSGQTERAFTFGLLYSVIYLRSDLGAVVRLLLESAAYRLVWMRAWLSVAVLSPSPSDVSKLWSSGEPSLKKSRLRERTVTQRNAQRSTQNDCHFAGCAVF